MEAEALSAEDNLKPGAQTENVKDDVKNSRTQSRKKCDANQVPRSTENQLPAILL
jgi:hypothetical protein